MKIKKIALATSLLFATSGATTLATSEKSPISSTIAKTQKAALDKANSTLSSDNWMYLSIGAVLIVLLLLIVVIFWIKRRGKKKA